MYKDSIDFYIYDFIKPGIRTEQRRGNREERVQSQQ